MFHRSAPCNPGKAFPVAYGERDQKLQHCGFQTVLWILRLHSAVDIERKYSTIHLNQMFGLRFRVATSSFNCDWDAPTEDESMARSSSSEMDPETALPLEVDSKGFQKVGDKCHALNHHNFTHLLHEQILPNDSELPKEFDIPFNFQLPKLALLA